MMGLNSHLNWDRYRRELADMDAYPAEAAFALVERDFVRFYEALTEYNSPEVPTEIDVKAVRDLIVRVEYDVATAEIKEYEWKYFSDEEAALIESIQDAPPIPAEIYFGMQDESQMDWVSLYDYEKVEDIRERGFEVVLEKFNNGHSSRQQFDARTITFHSYEAAVIWMNEITGQISDGAWENAPQTQMDGWMEWVYARIRVDTDYEQTVLEGPDLPGMDFSPSGKLGEHDGMFGRMVYYVRASGVNPDYDLDGLKSDLKAINAGL